MSDEKPSKFVLPESAESSTVVRFEIDGEVVETTADEALPLLEQRARQQRAQQDQEGEQ